MIDLTKTIDLSTTYLGLKLKNPLVASASPLCMEVGDVRRLEDAGASAVVLHSLFEEQIEIESEELNRFLFESSGSSAEAGTELPELMHPVRKAEGYLKHVQACKKAVQIPVIASLNGSSKGGWLEYAARMEQAGADALELNIYHIPVDPAVTGEQVEQLEKMIRVHRDLVRLLHNFVTFSEFYRTRTSIFQVGTLFIDGRSCDLCLPVDDANKHASLAGLARACLLYCDCTRKSGEKRSIVAAVTGGDTDNLMVGRNGVFVDRKGNDWDATVTRIVENPIGIRQAFWSPYKSFVRMVEEQVAKRASAADQEARQKAKATAEKTAHADKGAPETAEKRPEPKKIDVGTVAAIGVAVGGIATFLSSILAMFFGLGAWMPVGFVGLLLAISGPSMLIAWLKLRQRNVGPILDANGWSVNAMARINIPFGAALTQVAVLPPGSRRQLRDPFAEKRRPWRLYLLLLAVLALAALWYFGRLDRFLPAGLRAQDVLGCSVPAPTRGPAPQSPAAETAKQPPAPTTAR